MGFEEQGGLERARKAIDDADCAIARLFEQRMQAVGAIAAYKQAHGLPVLDEGRQAEVVERNAALVGDELRPYYLRVLECLMRESRAYQEQLMGALPLGGAGRHEGGAPMRSPGEE